MTFGPSILGDRSPAAPPRGSPPPTLPTGPIPSQEDRLLAAAAYLGYVTGFWLVVPIVIYVLKRDKSRFVAHHALRALVLHLVAVPVFVVSWVVGVGLPFAVAAFVEHGGKRHDSDFASIAFAVALVLGWLLPWLAYLGICVVATVRAMQGRVDTTSLLGRTVEGWLGRPTPVPSWR